MHDRLTFLDGEISKDGSLEFLDFSLFDLIFLELLFCFLRVYFETPVIFLGLHYFIDYYHWLICRNQPISCTSLILSGLNISFLMNSEEQEENSYQNIKEKQGTTIISVVPRNSSSDISSPAPKKSRRKGDPRRKKLPKIQNEFGAYPESDIAEQESRDKELQRNSESKMRGVDEETTGDMNDSAHPVPYQFLTQRQPSLFRIFFPRFTVKSVTFWLSITYVVMFGVLLIYNYSKEQTQITWNCSLYRLQNKYFPRINANHELWRVLVSAIFHSNIAHFCLNLFALQIYGYFIEWYYERKVFVLTFVIAVVYSHFFAGVVQNNSVSTTSSAFTMAIIGLKIFFLWEYRHYRKLIDRRVFLYILLGLIVGINLIPVFVVNNVDYSAHIGGLLVGLFLGMFLHIGRIEEPTKCDLFLRYGSIVLLVLSLGLTVALTFTLSGNFAQLSDTIEVMCLNNHT